MSDLVGHIVSPCHPSSIAAKHERQMNERCNIIAKLIILLRIGAVMRHDVSHAPAGPTARGPQEKIILQTGAQIKYTLTRSYF